MLPNDQMTLAPTPESKTAPERAGKLGRSGTPDLTPDDTGESPGAPSARRIFP